MRMCFEPFDAHFYSRLRSDSESQSSAFFGVLALNLDWASCQNLSQKSLLLWNSSGFDEVNNCGTLKRYMGYFPFIMNSRAAVTFGIFLLGMTGPFMEVKAQSRPQSGNTFISEADQLVTIRRIALLPVTDNIDGIYSKPIQEKLKQILSEEHRFDYIDSTFVGTLPTPQTLAEDEKQTKQLIENAQVDAVIAVKVARNPGGITLNMSLFLRSDGKLLAQQILKDYPKADIKDLEAQTANLYTKLLETIPYQGVVLSRKGEQVTLNIGSRDGIRPGQVVTPILVLVLKRHPKLNFLVSAEKEVLGKIRIEKTDETLSFGTVIAERERGVIQKLTKVGGLDFVTYDAPRLGQSPNINPSEEKVVFGENPKEWVPMDPPTLGKIGFLFGLGTFSYNTKLSSSGAQDGKSSLFPSIVLHGEMWLTQNWTIFTDIFQGVAAVDNPHPTSSPRQLNVALRKYSLNFGYNFLVKGDFFGPKVMPYLGFSRYTAEIDSSSPLIYTTTTYSGMLLGLLGTMPISDDRKFDVGANVSLYLFPTLAELPDSSGATTENNINQFGIFGGMKISENVRGKAMLDFELYSTTFSGRGTRSQTAESSSQRMVILGAGIDWLF